jgi:hypothetical protein
MEAHILANKNLPSTLGGLVAAGFTYRSFGEWCSFLIHVSPRVARV